MKRRITHLVFAGLLSGTAGWLAFAADPSPPPPVRLLKPIAIDEPTTVVTPGDVRRTSGNAEESTSEESTDAPAVDPGFPPQRNSPTRHKAVRRPVFFSMYDNWGKPREQAPQLAQAEEPTTADPLPMIPGEEIVAAPVDEEIPPPSFQPSASPKEIRGTRDDVPPPTPAPPAEEVRNIPATAMHSGPNVPEGLETFAPPYLPSNKDLDALPWVGPFEDRAISAPVNEDLSIPVNSLTAIPPDFMPWWEGLMDKQMRNSMQPLPVDLDILSIGALEYSPQVLSLRTDPEIRSRYLSEESATFDWRAFWDTKWSDLNNPVGNTLTTGGPDRFKDRIWSGSAGLRQKNVYGGELQIAQKLGYEDQNSIYFIPPHQGTARLELTYSQPLLNGSGRAYNRSRIMLAQIDSNRSFDEVSDELQTHMLKVIEAYWELYRARSAYLQRQKLLLSAEDILDTLGGRRGVDALQRQVLRAQAAVAGRRSEIVRTAAAIRNAESRLRLLVNDPRLIQSGDLELIPLELPRRDHVPLTMTGSLQSALTHRPDISIAIRDLRAAGVQLGVAENELLPRLDVVLQTYVAGLAGGGNIGTSLGNQMTNGRPSYSAGLEFEMPLGNRAANARYDRRQFELIKAGHDFRTRVETGLTEVELAVRETETAYRETVSRYQSLVAAQTEASYLEDRWHLLPGDDRGTTLLLEDLLDAQQRLADTEADFVEAQTAYVVSLARVRRSMGTLLMSEALPFDVEVAPVTAEQKQPKEQE